MMRTIRIAIAAATMAMLPLALVSCGGGGADVSSEVRMTTVGQELTDLKKAYDSGAINQTGYERQRLIILNRK
jgi:hypothetical protein